MKNMKKTFWYPTILALMTAVISGAANFFNKIGVTAVKDPILYTTLKNSLVALFLISIFEMNLSGITFL